MSSRLNILLVIDSLTHGGAQRQLVELALGLADRNHNVKILVYVPRLRHFRSVLDDRGIEVVESYKSFRFDPRPAFSIWCHARKLEVDCIISFLNTPNSYTILAKVLGTRSKIIVSERRMFLDDRIGVAAWLRYRLYNLADAVTVNSHHQGRRIRRHFPNLSNKLSVIWNGINLATFSPVPEPATRPALRLLAVGSIIPRKNAIQLIEALSTSMLSATEVSITWIGAPLNNASGQSELKRCNDRLRELGLTGRWQWMGVATNMSEQYRLFDALIHPSTSEGLPNAICEALASGLPVLASNLGDHPILVEDSGAGFLFDPYDKESIARVIWQFANTSRAERLELGRAARKFAERRLCQALMIEEYERLVREIVGNKT